MIVVHVELQAAELQTAWAAWVKPATSTPPSSSSQEQCGDSYQEVGDVMIACRLANQACKWGLGCGL